MRVVRNIIKIDEEKCTGCGLCVPACEEGAIAIIDGKARLLSELYCDGLGNCLGNCPEGAITIEQREAEPFDPLAVKKHLAESDMPPPPAARACPGVAARPLEDSGHGSRLGNWPVQLRLVPVEAPYFDNADLLIAADCTSFAVADFHERFLADRILLVGCPKLDDTELYARKLAQIFGRNNIHSIHIIRMEVPCCMGLVHLVVQALQAAGKELPMTVTVIGVRGEVQETKPVAVNAA
ncbi:MAG: ATP-binding protein [Candidatus Zipacnadales bacterium]